MTWLCIMVASMNIGAFGANLGERYYFSAFLNLASGVLFFALIPIGGAQ